MFLIRTVFWLSLVVLVLPIDRNKIDSEISEAFTAEDAFSLAGGTLSDFSGFCVRNPEVCVQGQEAFSAFGVKAKYVSGLAYDYISAQLSEEAEADRQENALTEASIQKQS